MGDGVTDLGVVGALRVIVGFLITAGLALGLAFAVRRFWPGLLARTAPGKRVRSLGQSVVVSRTLTVHLVTVDDVRVIVAEGRNGVGITVLPGPAESQSASRSPP